MRRGSKSLGIALGIFGLLFVAISHSAGPESEPIASVGHGGLFDNRGQEIDPTPDFVKSAQSWYLKKLKSAASSAQQKEYDIVLQNYKEGLSLSPQDELLANQAALVWLAGATADRRTLGKMRALEYRLRLSPSSDNKSMYARRPVAPNTVLLQRISTPWKLPLKIPTPGGGTANKGKEYVDECSAAQVPIPPPIGKLDPSGKTGWKSAGYLQGKDQFIVRTLAEVRIFESPSGICYALPRYTDDSKAEVGIDGVICLSKTTSKVCFWDNQMSGAGFSFPSGTLIPIGYPDLGVNATGLYQAGGAELEGGSGGICTDCHAGENPFVVHPRAELATGITWGSVQDLLAAFGADRYQPIVPASWPQNSSSADEAFVPKACKSCHSQDGAGGRLPALSTQLDSYCNGILPQALTKTMPPKNPGSQAGQPDVVAFLKSCQGP